ncbi:MAG TPA: guanylate kinase [Candidatus Hydrogenedentes bacterium]|nr:guanylate kinase [Candidatus Hydrogenedentota bacterium]HRZ81198.1 guanylate kinase [Candidatus Hydrogenedentota bacterium]
MKRGNLYVLSAPSGAGKNTVLDEVRRRAEHLVSTVSATTRAPRPGEVDGRDYHFLAREEFDRRVAAGGFAEWAEVHGNRYGTLHSELERCLAAGRDILLQLDVQGMRSLKRLHPGTVGVFLAPPSLGELERRLRARGTNSEEDIAVRLRNARAEMAAAGEFDHVVVNDTVARAADEILRIMAERRGE